MSKLGSTFFKGSHLATWSFQIYVNIPMMPTIKIPIDSIEKYQLESVPGTYFSKLIWFTGAFNYKNPVKFAEMPLLNVAPNCKICKNHMNRKSHQNSLNGRANSWFDLYCESWHILIASDFIIAKVLTQQFSYQ